MQKEHQEKGFHIYKVVPLQQADDLEEKCEVMTVGGKAKRHKTVAGSGT